MVCLFKVGTLGQQKPPVSLVPVTPSTAPDYFCTWNLQGYVTNYLSSENPAGNDGEKSVWYRQIQGLGKNVFTVAQIQS